MEWMGDESELRPKLLDPTKDSDDPLCYFTIGQTNSAPTGLGWIDPLPGLSPEAHDRADYTITRLSLNTRNALVRGRRKTMTYFGALFAQLVKDGPDALIALTDSTVRKAFAELLAAKAAFLAPLRQMFHEHPLRRQLLIKEMPELSAVIDEWALPITHPHTEASPATKSAEHRAVVRTGLA